MNEDSLPKMKTFFGSPLPALSPSDGERVASGRVRGIFTLEDRLGVRIDLAPIIHAASEAQPFLKIQKFPTRSFL
jgi:hypothetical protein